MLMAGADVTMLCSALLRHGIGHLTVIEREMREWMEAHGSESVERLKGTLSQKNCADPSSFERAIYAGHRDRPRDPANRVMARYSPSASRYIGAMSFWKTPRIFQAR